MAKPGTPRGKVIALPDNGRAIWEKLPGESRPAFAAFAHYRDLGPYRSVDKAAKDLGKSSRTLAQHSRKYRWVERTEAYDDELDARLRAEREGELLRAERQEAQVARAGITLAARRILGSAEHGVQALDPNELDGAEVASMLEKFVRVRRLSMGQPTDLLRGHFQISSRDMVEAVESVYNILMEYVPQERRPRAASHVQLYLETGRAE
jgi:hypothetical protein